MDFYNFKTEFRKLIEPTSQREYWGDVLKMNHLGGPALTLVDKIEDINEMGKTQRIIWQH